MPCRLKMIVAMDRNGTIGQSGGGMPWGRTLKTDLGRFKQLTSGHALIMGGNTFRNDIKRPLPNRTNIVISTKPNDIHPDVTVVTTLLEAMLRIPASRECFVIGGAQIYALAMPYTDTLHITRIDAVFNGDIKFPEYDQTEWELYSLEQVDTGPNDAYTYTMEIWHRKQSGDRL